MQLKRKKIDFPRTAGRRGLHLWYKKKKKKKKKGKKGKKKEKKREKKRKICENNL